MKINIAITGASGSIYALKLLNFLLNIDYKINLIISDNGYKVLEHECKGFKINHKNLQIHDNKNLCADIASGSNKIKAMIIIPCSMGSLARIANGISNDLISRSADICLKEKYQLIICPRETPFNTIHLRNMLSLSQDGAVILPCMPAFYHLPKSLDDISDFLCGKVLDILNIKHELFKAWKEPSL